MQANSTERKSTLLRPAALLALSLSAAAHADVFNIPAGDVAGLRNAIDTANANGEADTINLAAGAYNLATTGPSVLFLSLKRGL